MAASKKQLKKSFVRELQSKFSTGIAWYSPAQWAKLRRVAADPEKLEATYEEWLTTFKRTFKELKGNGVVLTKVRVEVQQLVEWCNEQNLPINGGARARYVADIVGQQRLVENSEHDA